MFRIIPFRREDAPKPAPGRAESLGSVIRPNLAALEGILASGAVFSSLTGYGGYLRMMQAFHCDLAPLLRSPALYHHATASLLRKHGLLLDADLADLRSVPAERDPTGPATRHCGVPEGLGWLFAAEALRIPAGPHLNALRALGLSADYGARHLLAQVADLAGEERAAPLVLDQIQLRPSEEGRCQAGAEAACACLLKHAGRHLPGVSPVPVPEIPFAPPVLPLGAREQPHARLVPA